MQHIIVNLDLAGAEWVVTAYLCGDPHMLDVVRSGKSPHPVTARLITGYPEELVVKDHKLIGDHTDPTLIERLRRESLPELYTLPHIFLPRSMSLRQAGKKSNHALNYGMKFRRFALENEITEAEAKPLVDAYTQRAYTKLPDWWASIRRELKENNRTLENCFGRRVTLMGEWGHDLFNAAYSFKSQSTVGDCTNTGLVLAYEDRINLRRIKLGAQVHDSLMLMQPIDDIPELAAVIRRVQDYMTPELRINGHTFRLKSEAKVGWNWGEMTEIREPYEESLESYIHANS
jgi:DNA polymerase I-like protein with 3'-5' exonuclease and polymerase domains